MTTVIYWFWRLGSFLVGHLPLALSYTMADWCGRMVYWLLPPMRRSARANYAQVMNKPIHDPAVAQVTKLAFRNFCRYLLEVLRFPYITSGELNRRVVLHDSVEFERALAERRGVIFVSAHFGNMELAGVQLATRFARMTLAAEVLKAKEIYTWLVENRARHNVRLIPYKQAARTLLTALRANEFVGFFLDLGIRYDHKGVPVKFFGETAHFPAAPALLAHRTGAPIIQGYAVIAPDGRIHGHAFPTLNVDRSMDRDQFVQHVTQQMAANMEKFIAQNPEQWYIFRPIWPDGVTPLEATETSTLGMQAG
jgi:KDO2-lipid IV(A) lauroyltransferase